MPKAKSAARGRSAGARSRDCAQSCSNEGRAGRSAAARKAARTVARSLKRVSDDRYYFYARLIGERNEKAFHIVGDDHRDKHRNRLRQEGIDVDVLEKNGQLKIARWQDAYLKEGYFDQNRAPRLIPGFRLWIPKSLPLSFTRHHAAGPCTPSALPSRSRAKSTVCSSCLPNVRPSRLMQSACS